MIRHLNRLNCENHSLRVKSWTVSNWICLQCCHRGVLQYIVLFFSHHCSRQCNSFTDVTSHDRAWINSPTYLPPLEHCEPDFFHNTNPNKIHVGCFRIFHSDICSWTSSLNTTLHSSPSKTQNLHPFDINSSFDTDYLIDCAICGSSNCFSESQPIHFWGSESFSYVWLVPSSGSARVEASWRWSLRSLSNRVSLLVLFNPRAVGAIATCRQLLRRTVVLMAGSSNGFFFIIMFRRLWSSRLDFSVIRCATSWIDVCFIFVLRIVWIFWED